MTSLPQNTGHQKPDAAAVTAPTASGGDPLLLACQRVALLYAVHAAERRRGKVAGLRRRLVAVTAAWSAG